jgi:HAMP domain-containing protein
MRSSLFVVSAAVLLVFLANAAAADQVSGDYVESRNGDVYTGPCFANGQVGLVGNEATLAWKIRAGRGPIMDTEIRTVGAPITLGTIPGVVALVGCSNFPDIRDLAEIVDEFARRKYIVVVSGCTAMAVGMWKDADGKIRPKYMYLAPVQGTDLIVAATTYIDEFSKPAKAIEGRMQFTEKGYFDAYEIKIQVFYFVMLVAVVFMLMMVYFYSRAVIHPIRYLSEVADKISMGDLDAPIRIKGTGEVSLLAESFERMQTSVKAAIERLQKRKEPA